MGGNTIDQEPDAPLGASRPRRRRKGGRLASGVFSIGAHIAVLAAIAPVAAPQMRIYDPEPIPVELVTPRLIPPPEPPPPQVDDAPAVSEPEAAAAPPAPVTPEPKPRMKLREAKLPPPPIVPPIVSGKARTGAAADVSARATGVSWGDGLVGEGQLAGARTAGSGRGGRDCDMVELLERALRRDPDVQAAVRQAHLESGAGRRAIRLWNGDWVLSPGQEGKGLAGVRQAIIMEVGFAPQACKAEPVNGMVLITLAEGPTAPKIALGSGSWRWGDLLHADGAVRRR